MAHVVVLAGEYDLSAKSELREELSHLYCASNAVLDISAVRFIDATFVSELILLVRSRREKGLSRVTVVIQANSMVRRVFAVTGILALFNVVESYPSEADRSECVTHASFGRSLETALI